MLLTIRNLEYPAICVDKLNMKDDLYIQATFDSQGIKTELKFTPDQLSAFIYSECIENSAEEINIDWVKFRNEFCAWLESEILIDLINDRALKDALIKLEEGVFKVNRKIASGIPASEPRDGKLIHLVKPYNPKINSSYSIREKFSKNFDNIKSGDFVARLYLPKDGSSGLTVKGEKVPALSGKEIEIEIGEGLEIVSPEVTFTNIKANKDGYLLQNSNTLSIIDTLTISSNVDHTSGSIYFISNIHVKGDVKKGFSVIAEKTLNINGDCFSSVLGSNNSSIVIDGKIIGEDSIEHFSPETLESDELIKIYAKEEVKAKSIQSQSIFSFGNIIIQENASRCLLSSGNSIYIGKSLFSARVRTVCGIEVETLGNKSNAPNLIELIHPAEASREYLILVEKRSNLIEQQKILSVFLGPYIENKSSLSRLNSIHKKKIEASLKKLLDINNQLDKVNQMIFELKNSSRLSIYSRVNILRKAFPGTKIIANDKEYFISEEISSPTSITFDFKESVFTKTDISPIECLYEENYNEK